MKHSIGLPMPVGDGRSESAYFRPALPDPFHTESHWSSGTRHLITVGFGPRFSGAAVRLSRQAEGTGWFDRVTTITDARPDPWTANLLEASASFRRENPRGFGLWFWKPACVVHALSRLEDGAHLYYIDAGCELSRLGEARMKYLDHQLARHEGLFFSLPFAEKYWTKHQLLARFPEAIADSAQVQATWFGIRNTPRMRQLAGEWLELCTQDNYSALRDEPDERHPAGKAQHRHDQSVLSCLIKNRHGGIPILPWEDVFKLSAYVRNSWALLEPVHALRRKSGQDMVWQLAARSTAEKCLANIGNAGWLFTTRVMLRGVRVALGKSLKSLLLRIRDSIKPR